MSFYLSDVYTLILVIFILALALINKSRRSQFRLLIELPLNQKYNVRYSRLNITLSSLIFFLFSVFIFALSVSFLTFNKFNKLEFIDFLKIFFISCIFFQIKWVMILLSGFLFDMIELSKKYVNDSFNSNLFLGIFFLPIISFLSFTYNGNLILNFSVYISYLYLILYVFLKLLLLFRLKVFKLRLIFYNILYLCLVELFPYISFMKYILSSI